MKNLNEIISRVLHDEDDVRAATAPFQAEFPYERDEEAQVTRREFCNFLGLTSAALFLGTAGLPPRPRWKLERQSRSPQRKSQALKRSDRTVA